MSDLNPHSELSDNQLIPLCIGNEADAWEELVRRHRRRVFNIAYQLVGRFDEAQDLTQDLFLKIYGALRRYDTSRNFVFWLTKITKNLCIDHYRQRRRERELFSESDEVLKVLESVRGNPYTRVRQLEKAEFLRRGLETLSPDLREAVVLRDIQELTYDEIAQKLQIPEGTVKSRINRGRTELARVLARREKDENVVLDEAPGQGGAPARSSRRQSSNR
jgi:RNA polymerase sigma-70 factor (ECF subfamily)